MSDNQNEDVLEMLDELTSLKQRADLLGLSYHPSIGLEKLREKVNAALSSQEETKPEEIAQEPLAETNEQKRRRHLAGIDHRHADAPLLEQVRPADEKQQVASKNQDDDPERQAPDGK